MGHFDNNKPRHNVKHGTLVSYITGFVLSVALTVSAYLSVVHHIAAGWAIIGIIFALAITQLVIQLLFFLHLGNESKPRLNLVVFLFMLLVIGIVAGGSLWIMHNLNYHMSPADMNNYMMHQSSAGGM